MHKTPARFPNEEKFKCPLKCTQGRRMYIYDLLIKILEYKSRSMKCKKNILLLFKLKAFQYKRLNLSK